MINLIKGNSADFDVTVTLDSEPYDLTTHKVWFTVKDSRSDPDADAYVKVTTADGITITNAAAGEITISLTPEETDALPTGFTLECDVQIRTPEGKVYTVLFDQIEVEERVTKAFDYTV